MDPEEILRHFGFGDFFGGGRRQKQEENRGADIQVINNKNIFFATSRNAMLCHTTFKVPLTITFMEAVQGCEKDIRFSSRVKCDTCSGTGCKPGTKPTTCPQCNGRGVEQMQMGWFNVGSPCRRCEGTGTIIANPCTSCSGRGSKSEYRTLTVKVPAGKWTERERERTKIKRKTNFPKGGFFWNLVGVVIQCFFSFENAQVLTTATTLGWWGKDPSGIGEAKPAICTLRWQ